MSEIGEMIWSDRSCVGRKEKGVGGYGRGMGRTMSWHGECGEVMNREM